MPRPCWQRQPLLLKEYPHPQPGAWALPTELTPGERQNQGCISTFSEHCPLGQYGKLADVLSLEVLPPSLTFTDKSSWVLGTRQRS